MSISSPTVCSFDVFDTCLTRKFAAPSDLFLELAHRILCVLPDLAERLDAETLWAARMEAEACARRKSAREEVTLDEIWQQFGSRVDVPELAAFSSLELELEEASLRPIADTLQALAARRAKGARILFISDTYLPADFVEQQLRRHGFAQDGDEMYISSEWGRTKATGHLFQLVLERENLAPRQLLHCGDHRQSDLEIPRRLGIKSRWVRPRHATAEESRLLALEGRVSNPRSQLVGAMQTYRLGKTSGTSPETSPLVGGMVAPFQLAFASWVLAQAKRDGVRRLYFLARDCQMTYQVARKIADEFDGIDCRYLHVSRQALLLPTTREISEEGMPWMRRGHETPTLERLLAKLELSYEDLRSDWHTRTGAAGQQYRLKGEADWSLFWESLNREPLRSRLLKRIETCRQEAQAYFLVEGLLDPVPWAVVDLGWYLSCQSALRHLLRDMDPTAECRGYYLGLRRERLGPMEAGWAKALFHQAGGDLPPGSRKQVLFQHATLFEHVLGMADHPSVHHYENAGPVFQSAPVLAPQLVSLVQAEVQAFAAGNAALAPGLGDPREAAPILSELMTNFAIHPSPEIARALAGLPASEDQNNLHASSIAAPMTGGELAAMWIPGRLRKLLGRSPRSSVWLEGRLAATPRYLRRLFALRKSVTAAKFPSLLPI